MTNSFEELLNSSADFLKKGDKVSGTVFKVEDDLVYVDVPGAQYDCVIPLRNLSSKRVEKASDVVAIGDEIEALVVNVKKDRVTKREDIPGQIVLSRRALDREAYRQVEEASWTDLEAKLASGEIFEAEVTEAVKGGLLVDVGVRAFVPASFVDDKFIEDFTPYVGQTLTFKVIELDRERNRAVLSHRIIVIEEKEAARKAAFASVNEGDVLEGTVVRLTNFGAFINLGEVDGLAHISELAHFHVKSPSEVVKVGDKVQVKVLKVDTEEGRIGLSVKATQPTPWALAEEKIHVGDELDGVVRRLTTFGAFVELLPSVDGLVHISEIAHEHIGTPQEKLTIGQEVKVKVLDVNFDEQRISLSIKALLDAPVRQEKAVKEVYETSYSDSNEDAAFTLGDKFAGLKLED